jgi:hypothetical protein
MPDAERYARQKARAAARGTTPHHERVGAARRHTPGISTGQASGRAGPGEVPLSRLGRVWTELPGQPVTQGTRDSGRMALLNNDIGRLKSGDLTPEEFDQRWGGKRIGPYEVPTAAEALANARARGPSPDRPYRRLSARQS